MYQYIKRIFDFILAFAFILVFIPIFIPLAIALKISGEGYIFYCQDRIGFKRRKFRIWKFATMLKVSPGLGTGSITLKNDWRLTPLGGFLRKTKINEVPQLINILMGDLSFVGPRPLMEVDFLKFPHGVQAKFYNNRPGLTGVASTIFRDTEHLFMNNSMDPHEYDKLFISPYKWALEEWYQEHISFWTDIKLLFLTFWVVIAPKSKIAHKLFRDLPELPAHLK